MDRAKGHIVQASCSIGRLPTNQIVISEERVSRRHALVNAQEDGEFWLVDLGSGNGTYLNGRRLVQPTLLADGDRIEIGSTMLRFRQPSRPADGSRIAGQDEDANKTIQHIKSSQCWLLVADIESSTQLIKQLADDELHQVTGDWLAACRALVERNDGSINKFLGDGFFAYWPDAEGVATKVAGCLEGLRAMQERRNPAFRVVMHLGQVFMGGRRPWAKKACLAKKCTSPSGLRNWPVPSVRECC